MLDVLLFMNDGLIAGTKFNHYNNRKEEIIINILKELQYILESSENS